MPPNGLTLLVGATAEETVQALAEAGCLTWRARFNRQAVVEVVAHAMQAFADNAAAHPGRVGPSRNDYITEALRTSGLLNWRGRRLYRARP
jgi:hypothetical protein